MVIQNLDVEQFKAVVRRNCGLIQRLSDSNNGLSIIPTPNDDNKWFVIIHLDLKDGEILCIRVFTKPLDRSDAFSLFLGCKRLIFYHSDLLDKF